MWGKTYYLSLLLRFGQSSLVRCNCYEIDGLMGHKLNIHILHSKHLHSIIYSFNFCCDLSKLSNLIWPIRFYASYLYLNYIEINICCEANEKFENASCTRICRFTFFWPPILSKKNSRKAKSYQFLNYMTWATSTIACVTILE